MQKYLSAALLFALLAGIGGLAGAQNVAPTPAITPNPLLGTPPPEIIHVYSRPLCTALHSTIGPAIGMMLQNDRTIAKSPPLFQDYVRGALAEDPNSDGGASSAQDLAVMRLENLVSPLADNVLAIQKQLEDKSVFPDVPRTGDEKRLAQLKAQMLQTLATQQAALDIINGFVDTQQLGEMQHEGFGYISAITSPSVATPNPQQFSIVPTQNPDAPPLFDNLALNAGLSPNPYELDLARIPGLAVGYNPVTRLKEGVQWTQTQGQARESVLAASVMSAVKSCKSDQPPSPKP